MKILIERFLDKLKRENILPQGVYTYEVVNKTQTINIKRLVNIKTGYDYTDIIKQYARKIRGQ